jgi:hypothetical protein
MKIEIKVIKKKVKDKQLIQLTSYPFQVLKTSIQKPPNTPRLT